jgi:hypothetical protein
MVMNDGRGGGGRGGLRVGIRKMENISRGPTFGDFDTIRTEASMQDVTVARLQSLRVKAPLSTLF